MIERMLVGDKEIVLVGTAHISRKSVKLVEELIEKEAPDVVGVELDRERLEQLTQGKRWEKTDLAKVIRSGRAYLLLLNILLASMQRRLGEQIGVKPGAEMKAAVEVAKKKGLRVILLDRNVAVTLKRAVASMSLKEKLKFVWMVFGSLFSGQEVSEEMVEELKQKDMLNKLIEELSQSLPSVKRVLVDERDLFIANSILSSDAKKVLAVVGAGHISGLKRYLDRKRDVAGITTVPKARDWFAVLKYAVPIIFFGLVAAGFILKGFEVALSILFLWFVINGSLSAIGAMAARAHWKSVLVAFSAAPFTSLHPALAAGWFAGFVELRQRAPQVKDFTSLPSLESFSDYYANRVTRILMVVAFTNVGSTAGTLVAIPYILSLLG